jgi:hypothetical protein
VKRAKRLLARASEAHRQGIEPCRVRFGVEAVHQHARCIGGQVIALRLIVTKDNAAQTARRASRNGSDLHRSLSPRDLTDYRHCEGGATSWSQSRESSSRITGMGRDGAPARTAETPADDEVGRQENMRTRCGARVQRSFRSLRSCSPITERQRPAKLVRSRERVVPPRGLEPQPTTFAALRPILGTVART